MNNLGDVRFPVVAYYSAIDDFHAYEMLGPLTREVMREAVVPISAVATWQWCRLQKYDPVSNDKMIAENIKRRLLTVTGVDYERARYRRRRWRREP